jgi:thiol-disulfide isomerase/thioredoxin
MSLTLSTMLPLATKAPAFDLLEATSGKFVSLETLKSPKATVIMFLCNHCPYVKHIQAKLIEVANNYQAKQITFIAISANDVKTYPQDGPDAMRIEAQQHHYPFPYLYDESQAIAKAYRAACTPDFYIFDKNLLCVYRGRFDHSTPGNNVPVSGADLTQALDAILAGQEVSKDQQPSMGCNIKWID